MHFSPSILRSTVATSLVLALAGSAAAQVTYTTPYYFSALAGTAAHGATDGPGAVARFYNPAGIAIAPDGNAYITDAGNNTIRKITPAGIVSTLAGTPGTEGNADGLGAAARFDTPWAIVTDVTGNIYVEDAGNNAIRKITPQGEVTTILVISGTTVAEQDLFLAAGRLPAALASATIPSSNGWEYIAPIDEYEPNGLASGFLMLPPPSLATDTAGNAYTVVEATICKTTPAGTTTTLAGTSRSYGAQDGVGSAARFSWTLSPATDAVGNVLVADTKAGTIRRITPAGEVTTLAGTSKLDLDWTDFVRDGDKAEARFGAPSALAVASSGNILVADDSTIRLVTPAGAVSTLAGLHTGIACGSADGTGTAARFGRSMSIALARDGNLYAADTVNHTIRKITTAGVVTTLAGSPGAYGTADGTGTAARFASPGSITCDTAGNLYIIDRESYTIRRITPAGVVTTIAGRPGVHGSDDGPAASATFDGMGELAVDSSGNVFVQHYYPDFALRKIAVDGTVTTVHQGTIANLASNRTGEVYASIPGPKIARVNSDGTFSVVLDLSTQSFDSIAPGFEIRSSFGPFAIDDAGNVYTSSPTGLVLKITPSGTVSALAGAWRYAPGANSIQVAPADGLAGTARFEYSGSIAVDATGTLYIADGSTIRKGQLAGPVTITTQPQSQSATAGTNVQFSVTATGIPAPSYQWRLNGTPISGATAATLSLTSVTAANAGDYTVVATNALGSATSSAATLTVTAAPVTPTTPSAPSSGGGGALGACFALVLLALGAARQRTLQAHWTSQQ